MINLGTYRNGSFFLPDNILTARIAIIGRTGSGKSYLASILMEEFLIQGMPIIVIDPQGHHYGLREKWPIYIFGDTPYSDFKITHQHGKIVAKIICEFNINAILDVSRFYKSWREEFVWNFIEELMLQNNRRPRHVFMDAADNFLPQNLNRVAVTTFDRCDKLVREGRGNGLGVTLISQRPQLISKDSLSQADLFLFLNMIYPNEIRIVDLILLFKGMNPQDIHKVKITLPNLKIGEGLIYAPALLQDVEHVHFRKKIAVHTGYTPEFGKEPIKVDMMELGSEKEDLAIKIKELIGKKEGEKSGKPV